jgi:hypothetical protein
LETEAVSIAGLNHATKAQIFPFMQEVVFRSGFYPEKEVRDGSESTALTCFIWPVHNMKFGVRPEMERLARKWAVFVEDEIAYAHNVRS